MEHRTPYRGHKAPIARENRPVPLTPPSSPPFDASTNPVRPATERHALLDRHAQSARQRRGGERVQHHRARDDQEHHRHDLLGAVDVVGDRLGNAAAGGAEAGFGLVEASGTQSQAAQAYLSTMRVQEAGELQPGTVKSCFG